MEKQRIFLIIFMVGSIMMISFVFYGYQILFAPNIQVDKPDTYLDIYPGTAFSDVQEILYDRRIVNDPVSFGFLSRIMRYDENIKAGHYLIQSNSTNIEAIRMLRAGEQEPVDITFSNVRLLQELPEKLCHNIALTPGEFATALLSESTAEGYGFSPETFPCMFIPNTYEVYWTIGAQDLLDRLHREYEQFWSEDRIDKASTLGLSKVEVSILASIVQAESRHYDESPVIAGLYLNRLRKGMLLQADPTLVYAMGDFSINRVLNAHKSIDSPYNTYKYAGLPPGPINLPSIRSIDAVLNYTKHEYLYMCARDDFSGYHHFSETLSAHLRYARQYQQALDRAGLFK
jgi:UPF0755 protein